VAKKTKPSGSEGQDVAGAVNPAAAANPAMGASVSCPTCGEPNPPPGAGAGATGGGQPVDAVGQLTAQIPTPGIQKGLAQLTAGAHQGDQVQVELLKQVLSNPENAYLGRYLCWVFASGGVDTFTVLPRGDADVARLAEVLSPAGPPEVVHVIVGRTVPRPIDSPCAVPGLPTVQADRLLAFTLQEFAAALPEDETSGGEKSPAAGSNAGRGEFEAIVPRIFLRLTRGAALPGLSDEDRGLAYFATEYAKGYQAVWQAQRDGKVLVGVDARHKHSADRRIVSVRLTFRHPRTDITERYQSLVDVTEPAFHFLITGLQPSYD
jgi:hypothetical protein